ncbi:MAG: DUF6259 domain-containing protein [Actinomycetota bacterium]|nr:DUF6259 domain-containing protein [Actinomycetota bacterium]
MFLSALLAAGALAAPPAVAFQERPQQLVVTTPAYRLTLSRRNGAVLALDDRVTGVRLVHGSVGCLWGAALAEGGAAVGGCRSRVSYRWDRRSRTLTLRYAASPAPATATLRFRRTTFDLRLSVLNAGSATLAQVALPSALRGDAATADAAYVPTYLPGIRLGRGFFERVGSAVRTYPSRWAFADLLAFDADGSHLALSSVNPAPAPLAPVSLGFTHHAAPSRCGGTSFCATHAYETWIRPGESWTSPVVRIRVGGDVRASVLGYRTDNRIDRYPNVAEKLGPRLTTLARAPLLKANLQAALPRFSDWGPTLRRLPSPTLLHPVAFQPGGHDKVSPDFLPPDPRFGSVADLRAMTGEARSLGHAVMPYLNVSWWDPDSPSLSRVEAREVAVADEAGTPTWQEYGGRGGWVVSPYAALVRERVARLMEEWRTDVSADCLFFDQFGARPWLRDFNPAAPGPLAYDDGWLALMAPYASHCLMVEDGWDRLAESFVGFHGSALMLDREHDEPDEFWGEGNWRPWPLALWLFHDKVLMYQHDLAEETMTDDAEVLLWNLAFGLVLSYSWDERSQTLESPWLERVGALQRTLGPLYAGRTLDSWRELGDDLTESRFGELVVVANWSRTETVTVDGRRLGPFGFLARTADGKLLASSEPPASRAAAR